MLSLLAEVSPNLEGLIIGASIITYIVLGGFLTIVIVQ